MSVSSALAAAIEAGLTFSSYYYSLEESATCYSEKLALVGGIRDLYLAIDLERGERCLDWQNWPAVEYHGTFNYLITTPPYTMTELIEPVSVSLPVILVHVVGPTTTHLQKLAPTRRELDEFKKL